MLGKESSRLHETTPSVETQAPKIDMCFGFSNEAESQKKMYGHIKSIFTSTLGIPQFSFHTFSKQQRVLSETRRPASELRVVGLFLPLLE